MIDRENGTRIIGTDRQLFVDQQWIAESRGVELRLHSPVRREVAIAAEHPWEQGGVSYMVTFADRGKYRAWYRCDCEMPPKDSRIPLIGYAESDDGIHWDKPFLGLVEYEGSRDNNLVWAGPGNNMAPFRDDSPEARKEERYKAIVREGDVYALASPDGLHWEKLQEDPILTERPFDSHNIAFWDAELKRYAIYARGVAGEGDFKGGVRWIRRSLSEDFRTWSPLVPVDAGETPFEHLYTNSCVQYDRAPGTYLMFPSRFVYDREPIPGWEYGPGVNDILFMSSRDGLHFHRFMEAFVRPGPDPENWHERAIFMERGILPASATEMSLYGMEHWRMPSVCIRRYSLRTDGFVSVRAGYEGGELVTPPVVVGGRELELNYSTSAAGSLCVEVQRPSGEPIEGFGADACGEVYGDRIEGAVTWGGSDLASLREQPVRLRFALRDADLYAFRFR